MVKLREYSEDLREIVIAHHLNNKKPKEIFVFMAGKINLRTIRHWIKQYKDNVFFLMIFFFNNKKLYITKLRTN